MNEKIPMFLLLATVIIGDVAAAIILNLVLNH